MTDLEKAQFAAQIFADTKYAQAVNTELVLLNWHIGQRIRSEIIGEGRAEYGEQVVKAISKALTKEYGRGFSSKSLFHMIRFAEAFPDNKIVSTLSRQLTWSHFIELLQLTQGEIRVAEYLTELPPQPVLQAKLREAIRVAKEQIERRD